MADNNERAARLVLALEKSVAGDVTGLEDLYTKNVTGSSPRSTATSLPGFATIGTTGSSSASSVCWRGN